MRESLRSGEILYDQTHRELVYCPLQFHERGQLFVGKHDETLLRPHDRATVGVLVAVGASFA
jgi:hypothetical protein